MTRPQKRSISIRSWRLLRDSLYFVQAEVMKQAQGEEVKQAHAEEAN
jgi:hypothetical protein